ncbi:MAG: complex I subunit 5 family protein [bacterium]
MYSFTYIPIGLITVPFLGALLCLAIKKNNNLRSLIVILTPLITLLLSLKLYSPIITEPKLDEINISHQNIVENEHLASPLIFKNKKQKTKNRIERELSPENRYNTIHYSLKYLPNFNLNLKVDPLSLIFIILTSLIWVFCAIFSYSYMTIENNRIRYDFANLACLATTLGVFMAGDLLTLYIFFEAILLFLYLLIIHREDTEALSASKIYLYFGVATGLLLLLAIFLLYHFTGTLDIQALSGQLDNLPNNIKYAIIVLLIIGFGGKAGIFLEHIWLPKSYVVAPTLTAALSSGIMIKIGAYGFIRIINMFSWSNSTSPESKWITLTSFGYILIFIGVITMFLAVLSALISTNSIKMLGYHSISQMGYIVLGIGCAAYLGKDGAMGLAGAIYHIVNHALFKASLFLGVGAVYYKTKELDMYKLGGLWRDMPIAALTLLIAVCGISGLPGFNGFASKTLLHHALIEAYQHSVHLSSVKKIDLGLRFAEIIFVLTAAGTFASNMKLFVLTYLGKKSKRYSSTQTIPMSMKVSLCLFSSLIIFLGLRPNWLIEHFIGPVLGCFHFSPGSHAYHTLFNIHNYPRSTIPILFNPINNKIFTDNSILNNLLGISDAVMLGGMFFILGLRFNWFHIKVPKKLQIEQYYRKLYNGFIFFCVTPIYLFVKMVNSGVYYLMINLWLPKTSGESCFNWMHISSLDKGIDGVFNKMLEGKDLWRKVSSVEDSLDNSFDTIIFNKSIWRFFTSKKDVLLNSNIWNCFSYFEKRYNDFIERICFSLIGSEDISKLKMEKTGLKKTWFLELCNTINKIHSGDISIYITWITGTLAVITSILIGVLYVKSFIALIILTSITLIIIIALGLLIK